MHCMVCWYRPLVNGQAFHLGLRTQKCDLQTEGARMPQGPGEVTGGVH